MEHTKTPWRIGKQTGMGSVVADEPVPEINGSDSVDYYGGHLIAESIAARNAEFIVRACNAHDQLVAALRDGRVAIDVLMAQLIEVDTSFMPTRSAAWPALVAIKAALDALEVA